MKTVLNRARGAKPPAKIFWYHGSTRILDQGLWHADNDDEDSEGDNDDGHDDGHDGDDFRGDDGEESIFWFHLYSIQEFARNWFEFNFWYLLNVFRSILSLVLFPYIVRLGGINVKFELHFPVCSKIRVPLCSILIQNSASPDANQPTSALHWYWKYQNVQQYLKKYSFCLLLLQTTHQSPSPLPHCWTTIKKWNI